MLFISWAVWAWGLCFRGHVAFLSIDVNSSKRQVLCVAVVKNRPVLRFSAVNIYTLTCILSSSGTLIPGL